MSEKELLQTDTDDLRVRLESLNPDYKPLEFGKEQLDWIRPAVEFKGRL